MSEHDEEYDDDFTEDLAESIGYNSEFDWDSLGNEDHELHDRIIMMSAEELAKLDYATLSDLHRWAAAQAWADFDDYDRFLELANGILASTTLHPALDYGAIAVEILNDLIVNEEFDEARKLIAELPRLAPEDATLEPRFTAIIEAVTGDPDKALQRFQGILDALEETEDGYAYLAVAADMIFAGLENEAIQVLDKAEELAMSEKDDELVAEIREAREYATEQLKSRD